MSAALAATLGIAVLMVTAVAVCVRSMLARPAEPEPLPEADEWVDRWI